MVSFSQHISEDRRLVMLRVLMDSAGYRSNEYVVQTALAAFGHVASGDQVRTDLAWLSEQGLLTSELAAGMLIATLTRRGEDVARGTAEVPGVKRPHAGF